MGRNLGCNNYAASADTYADFQGYPIGARLREAVAANSNRALVGDYGAAELNVKLLSSLYLSFVQIHNGSAPEDVHRHPQSARPIIDSLNV
ncbi:hypothetical protein MKK88_01235, partial [Methylobacterium sp. E-005]|uniref:hypothetical protein n=1 Tax=Methylobacterium sp. E-005 TaxID=2836549 RepID=UPI001FBA62B9